MFEMLFSMLILFLSYFLTTLALIRVSIPESESDILNEDRFPGHPSAIIKALLIGVVGASICTGIMVYFFIYPLYVPA